MKELRAGKEIRPTSQNYLDRLKEFDLDKEVILDQQRKWFFKR